MRALLVLGTLQVGGAERNVVSLAPRLRAQGVEASLCTLTRERDGPLAVAATERGLRRLDLGARRLLDPHALARLVALLRGAGIDVVHAEDHAGALLGAPACAIAGVPFVVTRHVLEYPTTSGRERAKGRLLDDLLRRGPVDRVIAVSEGTRRHLVDAVGVPPDRVVTVHNGVPLDVLDAPVDRAAARAALGWPLDEPIVTMVAVLRHGKGHEVLLDAVPRVRASLPVHVVLVGAGDEAGAIAARAAAVGGVTMAGQRDDIPLVLRASDVVVLPSWTEALPTVLIEAGAAGVPVVATDVGGAGEIVDDGVTGHLIRPGDVAALADHLVGLLRDPAAAAAMGARARERVRAHFSLDGQAAATAAVYREVLRRPSRKAFDLLSIGP